MPFLKRRAGIATTAVATVVAIGPALGLAHAICPEWIRHAGLDVWNLGVVTTQCRLNAERRRELDLHHRRLVQHIEASNCIAALLADGRFSLVQAVGELESVLADQESFDDMLTYYHPNVSTRQRRFARYLMAKVYDQMAEDPSRLKEARERLERDYQSLD